MKIWYPEFVVCYVSITMFVLYIIGMINEIDESSAYSWDGCDQCGLDKLAEKANTKYVKLK